jgi:predicted nucleic-acid-binding Zn-ribbon protein
MDGQGEALCPKCGARNAHAEKSRTVTKVMAFLNQRGGLYRAFKCADCGTHVIPGGDDLFRRTDPDKDYRR